MEIIVLNLESKSLKPDVIIFPIFGIQRLSSRYVKLW